MPPSGKTGRRYRHRCTICSVVFFSEKPVAKGRVFVPDRCGGEVCLVEEDKRAQRKRVSDLAVEVVLHLREVSRGRPYAGACYRKSLPN